MKSEQAKRKLCQTLYRFGVSDKSFFSKYSNIYIDDSGYVMIMCPDGVISPMGELSLTGEFVCTKMIKME